MWNVVKTAEEIGGEVELTGQEAGLMNNWILDINDLDTENNIVGKAVRMHQVFLEMGYFLGLFVNDEQSGMRADPKVILIVTDHVA